MLIEQQYERMGIADGWSEERVAKCSRFLERTYSELAALCAVKQSQFKAWIKAGKVPPNIALILFMLEQAKMRQMKW